MEHPSISASVLFAHRYEYGPQLIDRRFVGREKNEMAVDTDTCFPEDGMVLEIGLYIFRSKMEGHRFLLWRPVGECWREPCSRCPQPTLFSTFVKLEGGGKWLKTVFKTFPVA